MSHGTVQFVHTCTLHCFLLLDHFFPSGTLLSNQAASHHLLELCHVHPSGLQDEEVEPVFLPLLLFSFVGDGCYVSSVAYLRPDGLPLPKQKKTLDHFSSYACHPCAGAMLIFSVKVPNLTNVSEETPINHISFLYTPLLGLPRSVVGPCRSGCEKDV